MAFLINHAEKIVAAIFAMVGVLALSSASWSPTDRSPVELEDIAKQNESKIQLNDWPEEEKEWFTDVAEVLKITSQENGKIVNVADFEIEPFQYELRPATEKRAAVAVLPPESPVASPVVFALAMIPEDEEEETEITDAAGVEEEADEKEMTAEEKEADALAKRFGLSKPAAPAGGGYPGAPEGYGGAEGYGNEAAGSYPGGYEAMASTEDMYGGGEGYDTMYQEAGYGAEYDTYGQGLMVEEKNVGVRAGISVRMVIDLQKQRSVIRKALHLEGDYLVAQQEINYIDLIVERRLVGRANSPWEKVSSDDLGEILNNESLGVDMDIVSPAVTRAAITMPLPRRAAGVWSPEEASHPRVEDFELSAEEKALIDKFNALMTQQIEEEEQARPPKVETRGFAKFSQSATDMQTMYDYGGSGGDDYAEMYNTYDTAAGETGKLTDADRVLLDSTKATAEHRLLLVRFMDFTVTRGRTYQYRARVAMKNPNYDFPLDELEDPALAAEQELTSPWSEPTDPVFLPSGDRIYLADVDAREGDQEKATLRVFTDTTETGLSLFGTVKVPVGMPVSGEVTLDVVDLRNNSVDQKSVVLAAQQLLAAAEEMDRLNGSDHPELKRYIDEFNRADRSAKPIPDQVCVISSEGPLSLRATGDNESQLVEDRKEYEGVLEIYKKFWGEKQEASGLVGIYGGEEGEGDMYGQEAAYGIGMQPASAAAYGATKSGRKLSSRERLRKQRSGELPKPGAGGMGAGSGSYE